MTATIHILPVKPKDKRDCAGYPQDAIAGVKLFLDGDDGKFVFPPQFSAGERPSDSEPSE